MTLLHYPSLGPSERRTEEAILRALVHVLPSFTSVCLNRDCAVAAPFNPPSAGSLCRNLEKWKELELVASGCFHASGRPKKIKRASARRLADALRQIVRILLFTAPPGRTSSSLARLQG